MMDGITDWTDTSWRTAFAPKRGYVEATRVGWYSAQMSMMVLAASIAVVFFLTYLQTHTSSGACLMDCAAHIPSPTVAILARV